MDLKRRQHLIMGVIASFFSDEGLTEKTIKTPKKLPKFYKGRDGPCFVLLDYNKQYEIRRYERGFWISRLVQLKNNRSVANIVKESSNMLREYLQRENSKEIYMGDSCALICKCLHNSLDACEITVSLALPEEYKDEPPAPKSKELFLEQQRSRIVYVGIFNSSTKEDDWNEAFSKTQSSLIENGEKFQEDTYYRVTYNSNGWGRSSQNEVWFIGIVVDRDYVCLRNDEELDTGE
eukprot:Seg1494.9 transcript_id=Seg1494.9/GoldUCD/mRNA.D3Y31 product="Heme-binding protein 2" protein_id=Seg1494.9/GoldUCD/D3Y31